MTYKFPWLLWPMQKTLVNKPSWMFYLRMFLNLLLEKNNLLENLPPSGTVRPRSMSLGGTINMSTSTTYISPSGTIWHSSAVPMSLWIILPNQGPLSSLSLVVGPNWGTSWICNWPFPPIGRSRALSSTELMGPIKLFPPGCDLWPGHQEHLHLRGSL